MGNRGINKQLWRTAILAVLLIAAIVLGVSALSSASPQREGAATTQQPDDTQTGFVLTQPPTEPPVSGAIAATRPPQTPLAQSPQSATMETPAQLHSPTPKATQTPESTPTLMPEPTPVDKPSPTPGQTKSPVSGKPLAGKVIGLDPGHQKRGNNEQEPVAPGSAETKKKVSSGTQGKYTGVAEHEVNLAVGLLLRDLLEDAGATVYMTRTKADVDISNVERAQLLNKWEVDLGIRLHCNGSTDTSKKGAFMLVPGDKNYPYYSESIQAAKMILAAYGEETGLSTERGITYRTDQTGFNWCERPVVNIEMGHMSYEADDRKLVDTAFQKKMAQGIFQGIVNYLAA